tara:strand:- start:18 stop:1190 length:1173 start_codon:yes stop_codon:yes gene_type:complete
MKILIIQCFDKPGGQSNRSYLFADELQKLGHDVTYYTNKFNHLDNEDKFKEYIKSNNKIKYIYVENKKFKKNKFLSVILNTFNIFKINKKFDIIIGPSVPLINSFFALIFFKLKRAKFYYEIRDVWPEALIYNNIISKYNPIYLILKFFEILIYKFCDGIITALPNTKKYIKFYNNKVPQLYLPNSYELFPVYDKKFNNEKIKIVYIGRFNAGHDLDVILNAAQILLFEKKIKSIFFDIYGYGDKLLDINKKILEKKLINVNLRGKLKKSDIFKTLKKYDLALCTITNSKVYKWGINLNKIYEYMNSSMPIIFTGNVPLNPVLKAKCGYVCHASDHKMLAKKILKFSNLSNIQKLKLSKNAKSFFDNSYNIQKQTKNLDNFLISKNNQGS